MHVSGLLIIGETGKGKTPLTWLIASLASELVGEVVVVDFAPEKGGIGSRLKAIPGARIYRPTGLRAPRLESGGDCKLMWNFARSNALKTTRILDYVAENPGQVIVVNDATIHTHAGDFGALYKALTRHSVAIVNAYYGDALRDRCGLSTIERRSVAILGEVLGRIWVAR